MKKNFQRKHPIFKKLFWPLLIFTILQASVFFLVSVFGGLSNALNTNAEDILTERVINRSTELENKFNSEWTNFILAEEQLNTLYNTMVEEKHAPLYTNADYQRQMLSQSSSILINTLRKNGVNGAFIVLNNSATESDYNSKNSYYGLCIRDYDSTSEYTDKEDLMIFRCPASISSSIGCTLDSRWEALYTFDNQESGNFFYNPLHQAYINPGVETDNLAYFSGTHNFSDTDVSVVSYSIPLIDNSGYPYGVLGIEITVSYLESLLPSEELKGQNAGFYAVVQYVEDECDYNLIAKNGVLYQRAFGSTSKFEVDKFDNNMITMTGKNDLELVGSVDNMVIYNKNTPFEKQHLALIGFEQKSVLYSMTFDIIKIIFLATLLVLAIGILGIFLVSRIISKPVQSLAKKVREINVNEFSTNNIQLERINLDEVDELVTALEDMSNRFAKNKVRTEFFSRMSHDMRTPMNAIIGFSSPEILNNATEVEKDEYLIKIQNSGTYLLGLINEVLDMTKIDSNKMELHEEVVPISTLWQESGSITGEIAKAKGVSLDIHSHTDNVYIYVDKNRINQIFVNLLSNAIKFTPEGGTVRFYIEQIEKTTTTITNKIIVEDNGIGMSEDFLKNLYQPFVQEHEGVVEGSGLGLSITKILVELMGGTIQCESTLGKGTIFTLIITNKLANNPEEISISVPSNKNHKVEILNGKRILICEDQPINFQIAKSILGKQGMIIEQAENGEEGVNKFSSSPIGYYAAILMDVRMPKMDGIEATKIIRKLEREDATTIPIIAMTANAFAEDVKETLVAGMNAHLSKPIEPQKLYETLEDYISLH